MTVAVVLVLAALAWAPFAAAQESAVDEAAQAIAAQLKMLNSDQFDEREEAMVRLVEAGAPAVPGLLELAGSDQPELAWRALETLQWIARTIDVRSERAMRRELSRARQSPNKRIASAAQEVLRKWTVFRHNYAATQLRLLGAEVVDHPLETLIQMAPSAEAAAAAAAVPAAHDAGAKPEEEGLFGGVLDGLFEELAEGLPDAREEVLTPAGDDILPPREALAKLVRALSGVAKDEGVADAEDEVVVDAVDVAEIVPGPALVAVAMDMGFDVPVWSTVVEQPAEPTELQPGTLRLSNRWMGGDRGLGHLASLQMIHTVILEDAPLSNESLKYLTSIPTLQRLVVRGTRITSDGLLSLKKERPALKIDVPTSVVFGIQGSDGPQGICLQQITPETGARRAGLAENDILTHVDGKPITSINHLQVALFKKHPGDKLKVEFLRNNRKQAVEVALVAPEDASAPDGIYQPPMPNVPSYGYPAPGMFPGGGFFGGGRIIFRGDEGFALPIMFDR